MAIQVRLDLAPQEFDLMRRALDTHRSAQLKLVADVNIPVGARSDAREEASRTAALIAKVR